MSLIKLWNSSPEQLLSKHVQQVIAFAGHGKLLDGSAASAEFREFLHSASSSMLARYADECLTQRFDGSGLALQDVINQIGRRLGFQVRDGRYRGTSASIGFDGVWTSPAQHGIVVEVKTTDAYRIDLDTLASYRRGLIKANEISEDASSILVVVGRQDTGDLEAQIRGSRYAWDIRLISIVALLRLLELKEEAEDPTIARKIAEVLTPYEYTRVDRIIDLVFATAEDVLQEQPAVLHEEAMPAPPSAEKKPKFTPVKFHDECVARIQESLGRRLVKRSRATSETADGSLKLICAVSREHHDRSVPNCWFAFHAHQREYLANAPDAYVAFGCGSPQTVVLIPFAKFDPWLEEMWTTQVEKRFDWPVVILREAEPAGAAAEEGGGKRGSEWVSGSAAVAWCDHSRETPPRPTGSSAALCSHAGSGARCPAYDYLEPPER